MAIDLAQTGKTPFGCVIARENEVLARAYNTVSKSHDPTAHGEVNAIRQACQRSRSTKLPDVTIFTTGEPCPMCMSAILYAKIPRLIFGATILTISQFMPQISISSSEVVKQSSQLIEINGPFMETECRKLLLAFTG